MEKVKFDGRTVQSKSIKSKDFIKEKGVLDYEKTNYIKNRRRQRKNSKSN